MFFFLLSLCHSHCDQINCQSLVITPSVTPEKREKRHTTTTPSSSTIDCCTERKKWSVNVWTAQKTMTLNYSYIDFWAATIDQISTCHQLLLESVYTSINFYFVSLVFNRTIEEFEFEKKNRIRKASLSILKWNVPHSVVDYYLDFKVNTKICYFVLLFSPNWPRSLATFYSINVYSMRRIVCLCALYCNRHRFKPDHKSQ